jgi:hypothetical protein
MHDAGPEDVHDPTIEAFGNLPSASAPPGRQLSPEDKRAMEEAITWLRNNDPKPEDVDSRTLQALTNLAGTPFPCFGKLTEPKKQKALEDALKWLRINDPESDDVNCRSYTP